MTQFMVSVSLPRNPTPEEEAEQEQCDARIKTFLDELTALSHKHGIYLESETDFDGSGGACGYINLEFINKEYQNKYSYGFDNSLNFADWNNEWFAKQTQWNKTIVGKVP